MVVDCVALLNAVVSSVMGLFFRVPPDDRLRSIYEYNDESFHRSKYINF
jgi:hypothetical protein